MNALLIFVSSERADQYLNSVAYCIQSRDVRFVRLVHIRGLSEPEASRDGVSGRVLEKVQSLLAALAEDGEYLFTSGEQKGQRRSLSGEYSPERYAVAKAYYSRCRNTDVRYSNEEIEYGALRSYLRGMMRAYPGLLVDVTAVRKRYLGDIIAAGLVEGLRGLYTFDIELNDYERPWRMLVHEREHGADIFSYRNLLETENYKSCLKSVAIFAPRTKVALSVGLLVLALLVVLSFVVGASKWGQLITAVEGGTGIVSLLLIFFSPRVG